MKTRGSYTGGSTCKDDPCTYPRESQFYQAEAARTYMIEQFMTDTTTDLTGKLPVTTQSEECPFNMMVVVDKMLVAPIEMLPESRDGPSRLSCTCDTSASHTRPPSRQRAVLHC